MTKTLVRLGVGIAIAAAPFTLLTSSAQAMAADCQFTFSGGETYTIPDGEYAVDDSYEPGQFYEWVCQEGTMIFNGPA